MPLRPGTSLGPYEVVSLLGLGGMGEVYRARDTKLNRDVALKILPEAFTLDGDRIARFRREAQVLASLNHPNIAAIYGFEDSGSTHALVLELVEGPTLADRIAQGAVPLDEAWPIARQIAEALEAAHEQGIIHRDLKPANIKVRADGTVKVLDFGLAKLADPAGAALQAGPNVNVTASPTITSPAMMTGVGVILGTAAYMSPEQAKGRPTDKRSDVWAFGCVVYEMLTGKRAFDGEDVTDAIASVVAREPDWAALPDDLPSQLRLLLRRCLEKDPRKRVGDISTARFLMTETIAPLAASKTPADAATSGIDRARMRRRTLGFASAALVAGAAIAAVVTWLSTRTPVESPRPVRFTINPPAAMPLAIQGPDRDIAISADGTHLVYRAGRDESQLVVRAFDQPEGQILPGINNIRGPFLSPDGHWIGFFGAPNGELKKVPLTGGPAITLCNYTAVGRGASWGPDHTIIFATSDPSTGLLSVSEGGGEPRVLTKPDAGHHELDHLFPSFLPGGKVVLFTITAGPGGVPQIAALDVKTGQRKVLIRGGSSAEYVEPGLLVFAAGGTLRAVRFDPARLEVLSDPVPVAEQVMTSATGAANFSVSRGGTLAYVGGLGPLNTGSPPRSLVWVDRQGREEPLKAPIRSYATVRLSPDETRLALDIRDQENDIWIWEFARGTMTRLTFDPAADVFPVWTPDGRRVAFGTARSGVLSLYWHAADGTGVDEAINKIANPTAPGSFSPDGTMLVVRETVPGKDTDISLLRMDSTSPSAAKPQTEPLISTTFSEQGPEISPDGHWIAYYSNESGQDEVYVRPFPAVNEGRWQISTGGGTRPAWARNGRELFYLSGRATTAMMAVPIQTAPNFNAGQPSKLFEGPFFTAQTTRTYDVSRDGQRFLMIKSGGATIADQGTSPSLFVVEHWTEELKARVPPQ